MRKSLSSLAKKCTAAVIGVAGLVGGASAVVTNSTTVAPIQGFNQATNLELNPNGLGHILVVPYFTTNGGNDTYLSINNTDTRNGKAVKVRFRGAGNSDDIFDFTVFLSPGDVWAAAVTKDATSGLSKLVTADKSCTLPANVGKTGGPSFITARVPTTNAAAATNEGYVEIFNMADIPATLYSSGVQSTATNALYTAIKHVSGVAPCTASAFNPLAPTNTPGLFEVVDSTFANYGRVEALGFTNPTTGLKANWTIINVPKSAAWTGAAVAVEARDDNGQPGVGNIVFYPQTSDAVGTTQTRLATADPLLRGGVVGMSGVSATGTPTAAPVTAAMYDLPDLSTPYTLTDLSAAAAGVGTRRQAFRLTQALAVSSVSNEFVVDASVLGQTDWVFSLPTRRYNVARDYSATTAANANLYTNYARDDASAAVTLPNGSPTFNFFATENISTNAAYPNILCVGGVSGAAGSNGTPTARLTSGQTGDREEQFLANSTDFVVSPGTPGAAFSICGETAVFSFSANGQTSALGAALTRFDIGAPFSNGWARIATPGLNTGAGTGLPLVGTNAPSGTTNGLPVLGYAVMQLKNGAAQPGLVGNYGLTFPHTRTPYAAQ